ncbi:MAG TPA: efflux RND transporter periplasmic adaptor subunit [Candidatus Sulfotelmatobacter sp.]|nr:efflux RND transporter periplasmic adaptor subunit [Candidatus Sulfotelmatobacter sp.]
MSDSGPQIECKTRRDVLVRLTQPHYACLLTLMVLLVNVTGCAKKTAKPPGPPEVVVATVQQQDVPIFGEWVSQLNGPINAVITPKVQGYLLTQNYSNGSIVTKGQLLFQIDPRPFQAALEQATADVQRAQASLFKANNDVTRDTPLAAQRAIPQKQLDDDIANQASAKAQLAAQNAAQQQAQLNLGWTKVFSPVNGIAGVANSQIGDLVGPTSKMTTVSQTDPIWAYFNISESLYLAFAPQISRVLHGIETKGRLPVQFIQANDTPYAKGGRVVFVNREITAGTGTIQLAAAFPNQQAILRPGGFGRVRVQTGTAKNALLVPQSAVIEVQSQYEVIVVDPDNKARVRSIKVGDRFGSNWIITEGLKPGERVVIEGIQKIQTLAAQSSQPAEGVPVVPKMLVAAGNS